MSTVARKRKNETVYFVANKLNGRPIWERVGTDKREAKRRDAAMKREIKAGVYIGKPTGAKTVGAYAETWLARRRNRAAEDDRSRYRVHVLGRAPEFTKIKLEDVRIGHLKQLADDLREPYMDHRGKTRVMAPRSHAHIFKSVLLPMFRDALIDELITRQLKLPDGVISLHQKEREPYDMATMLALTTDERIRLDARMFNTLLFYTGARCGEVCGLRFRDFDPTTRHLGMIRIDKQYGGAPLKGDDAEKCRPRKVPVLPALAAALKEWIERGFELTYCRRPTPDDFIVPRISDVTRHHSQTSAYAIFQTALKNIGARNQTMHATRNTFISFARRGGAHVDSLLVVTHNPKGSVIDTYTDWAWQPLCEAVQCFARWLASQHAELAKAS